MSMRAAFQAIDSPGVYYEFTIHSLIIYHKADSANTEYKGRLYTLSAVIILIWMDIDNADTTKYALQIRRFSVNILYEYTTIHR